jgi:hypothetical protein
MLLNIHLWILLQVDIRTLAEFYGSPKEDEFQGHICRVPSDLQSPEAAIGEFQAFKTHMFVERCVMQNDVSFSYLALK